MLAVSTLSAFGLASVDVSGVSGFVESVGTRYLWALNLAEMLLGLLTSAVYMQFADRLPRTRTLTFLLAGMSAIYLFCGAAFALFQAPAWIYPLLYRLRSQQIILFPIAFWNLANSLYPMSEARRVFPLLASGDMLGGLVGYTLFSGLLGGKALISHQQAFAPLLFNGASFALLTLFFTFGLREKEDQKTPPPQVAEFFWGNMRTGLQTIHEIHLFRYLALAIALTWAAFPCWNFPFTTR